MLGWFRNMMPKEERFFELFTQHALLVVAGAEALQGLLRGGEQVPHYARIIVEREDEADDITREVMTALRRSFITPFDRSDIQGLIQSLDDAIDQMKKTVKSIELFEQMEFDPRMAAMGDAMRLGTYAGMRLLRPFIAMTKGAIAAEGARLGVDFSRTWSCYKGGARHCGRCGTCVERREAFAQAGVADPTDYEHLDPLPAAPGNANAGDGSDTTKGGAPC